MNNKPLRFAHRGLVQYAPENTIEAFQAAIDHGCEGIELDIRLSKDGIPVVVHDRSLNRLSDGKAPKQICDMTADEIKAVDIPFAGHLLPHNPPVPYSESEGSVATYTPEQLEQFRKEDKRITHIVTFEEFDKWFESKTEDVTVEIEFCTDGLMKPMYEILSVSKNINRYIIFSGNDSTNREIHSVLNEKGRPDGLRVGMNARRITPENIDFIKNAGLYEIGLNDKWFTPEDVKMLEELNIKVFSNLGDYPEWWETITSLPIAAFKTNYAEAYTEWLNKQ
ncbi:MAG: hypothetical protein MJ177_02985 [Clostridia bacterium]|nr:hypothetical protein [Clostridia bacterium]